MFDFGRDDWRRRWHEVFKYKVQHWKAPKETRVSLDSLITAAHPGLKGDKRGRALLAHDFLWKVREERRRAAAEKAQRRRENKNEGGQNENTRN